MKTEPLLSGLDRLLEDPSLLRGRRLGLVANPASVSSRFVPAARALSEAGLDLRVLFGPEHGLTGAVQDMLAVGDGDTPAGGLPVVSLYGERFEDLSPKPEHLAGLDAVVCDLPDVGSRYYTFVWTACLVIKACAARGIPVFVLDRPNPLGGLVVEGNLPEERLLSFVGLWPVPARHGMTTGEIARYVNAGFGIGCDLTVVPMRLADGRPAPRGRIGETPAWVLPSPNMPTCETALVYPGMCLLEGTNLSEARGTTRPFEVVGAPWLDAGAAAERANGLGLPGVVFRPHVFRPTFHKFAGQDCGGVQLHVTDAGAFRPFETGLRLVKLLRDLDPARFRWRTETYEYRSDVPAIDLLAGTARYRELVDAGESLDGWIDTFPADLARFAPARDASLLYRPGTPRVQVVGAHDSGKTTHALALVSALAARGLSVGAVKHTRDEYETDVAGSDSQRHFAAGASPVVFVSGRRTGVHARHGEAPSLDAVIAREMPGVDVVVVEGFREEPGPKVEVCRAATGREPVCAGDPGVLAVLTDRETPHPGPVPRLPLGGVDALVPLVLRALGIGGAA